MPLARRNPLARFDPLFLLELNFESPFLVLLAQTQNAFFVNTGLHASWVDKPPGLLKELRVRDAQSIATKVDHGHRGPEVDDGQHCGKSETDHHVEEQALARQTDDALDVSDIGAVKGVKMGNLSKDSVTSRHLQVAHDAVRRTARRVNIEVSGTKTVSRGNLDGERSRNNRTRLVEHVAETTLIVEESA